MASFLRCAARRLILISAVCSFLSGTVKCDDATSAAATNSAITGLSAKRDSLATDEDAPVSVPAPSEKAVRHFRTGLAWLCARTIWDLGLLAAIFFTGLSARLRSLAFRLGRKWYFALCIYVALLGLILYVASWPLDYYQHFVRPHAYDLSNQTFGKWFGDSLKELVVTGVAAVLVLWMPYLLLRKSPRRAWLYAALAMAPIYFFMQMVAPVLVDPLFNDFTSLKDKALETKILALADRAGIHGSRIYEVNKSVDTKTVNAYVTGFLGTKRIVLWDTAIQKLNEHELLFVMGHEMGHYVLGHVIKGILCLSALTLLAFYLIQRTASLVVARAGVRIGVSQLDDFASLPLLIFVGMIVAVLLGPIGLAYSRHLEHEADRFGLEIARFNHSAATGFVRLQEESLSIPNPGFLYTIMLSTHPTIGQRIEFFNTYKPWKEGKPLKYGARFQ
jgi:STE24 endopeptidase